MTHGRNCLKRKLFRIFAKRCRLFIFQGHGLRKYRRAAGYSQMELAVQLGYGTSQFISNIENGKASIPSQDIPLLAEILNVEPKDIANLKLLDYTLKLAAEAQAPELKNYAKVLAGYEKHLVKDISDIKAVRSLLSKRQSS